MNEQRISDFLEEFGKIVPDNEPDWLVALMADDHKTVCFYDEEFYLQEDIVYSEEDGEVYDYLVEHYLI